MASAAISGSGGMVQEKTAPSLPGVAISAGDEHLLRELNDSTLQSVVDFVRQKVESSLGVLMPQEKTSVEVTFTNGMKLQYPAWMLSKKGKDLLPIYQRIFGQNVITPPNLEKIQRRIRLVPFELADIMHRLQQN